MPRHPPTGVSYAVQEHERFKAMREEWDQDEPELPSTPEGWVSPEASTPHTPRTLMWADEAGAPLTESKTTPRWIHPDDAASPSPSPVKTQLQPPIEPFQAFQEEALEEALEEDVGVGEERLNEESFAVAQAQAEAKARRDAWRTEYNQRLEREHRAKVAAAGGGRLEESGGEGASFDVDVEIAKEMAEEAQVSKETP